MFCLRIMAVACRAHNPIAKSQSGDEAKEWRTASLSGCVAGDETILFILSASGWLKQG
jgi:hypothetical protein